jgi:hypothetical protein
LESAKESREAWYGCENSIFAKAQLYDVPESESFVGGTKY